MKKILFYFLFVIIFATTVCASSYDVVYEITNRNNASILGVVNVADVILNKNLINREVLPLNFTPQTIIQYDSIRVVGNSITLDGVTYSPGQEKVYDVEGVHTYCEISNSTKCSSFEVIKLDNPSVNISVSNTDLKFIINNTNLVLDSEKVVKLQLNITNKLNPREYYYDLSINNITTQQPFEIKKIEVWNIINTSFVTEVETGKHGVFGTIGLESVGNTFSVLNVSVSGTETILFVDKDILLYPNTPVTLEILYDVNQGRDIGLYSANIVLNNVTIPINLSIRDSVSPEISEFNVTNVAIYNTTGFSFKAFDNLNINQSYIEYLFINTTIKTRSNATKYENDLFIDDTTTFQTLGEYTATACVVDDSNNTNCTEPIFFSVTMTDRVKVPAQTVHFKKVKFGEYVTAPLFNITEGINVRIKLSHIEYDNNTANWGMKVIDGDGSTEFILEEGKEIIVGRVGEVKLAFMGNLEKQYTGVLEVTPDWFNINLSSISFTGQIVNYKVPEPFSRDWYGDNLTCSVVDTSDVDTSYYDCNLKFSILSDLEKTAIPVTPIDKEENAKSWEDRLQVWKDKNSAKIGAIILFTICLALAIVYIIWLYLFSGKVVFKWK